MRLVAAIGVLVSHSVLLGGFRLDIDPILALTGGSADLGNVCVVAFFSISGYVVTMSAFRLPLRRFLWNRFLRILPGYWASLLFVALVIGPLSWLSLGRNLNTYFTFGDDGPWHFLGSNLFLKVGSWGIFDIFQNDTPAGTYFGISSMVGSIWSLYSEFWCYLMIAFMVLIKKWFVPASLVLSILVAISLVSPQGVLGSSFTLIEPISSGNSLRVCIAFLTGALLTKASRSSLVRRRLLFSSLFIFVIFSQVGLYSTVGVVSLSVFMISLGLTLPKKTHSVGTKVDLSYGIYLYAYSLQQFLVFFHFNDLGLALFTFLTSLITTLLALGSWLLVEKPSLRLKTLPSKPPTTLNPSEKGRGKNATDT